MEAKCKVEQRSSTWQTLAKAEGFRIAKECQHFQGVRPQPHQLAFIVSSLSYRPSTEFGPRCATTTVRTLQSPRWADDKEAWWTTCLETEHDRVNGFETTVVSLDQAMCYDMIPEQKWFTPPCKNWESRPEERLTGEHQELQRHWEAASKPSKKTRYLPQRDSWSTRGLAVVLIPGASMIRSR